MKPKVILDASFLGHPRSIWRGTERVVEHLFEGLLRTDFVDLSITANGYAAGVYDYLLGKGFEPSRLLRTDEFRLTASRIARRVSAVVHHSIDDRSLRARVVRNAMSQLVSVCMRTSAAPSTEWIKDAQIYHSPHAPFPEVVRRSPRLKRFITCHDFIPLKYPNLSSEGAKQFIAALLGCLRPENYAFCVSETTRNDVLNFSRMLPENVFVTPLAADPATFYPVADRGKITELRRQYGLGEDPYLLALSAHDSHKNFAHLIECFGILVESRELTEGRLVIAGPNPSRNPAAQEALQRYPRAADRILILGFVPNEDLAAIYSGSAAFLFPSFAEGFGMPALEAMQCGVPVIASNTTSIPEVVGDAGILLPPSDRDLWCDAMLRISRDPRLRADLATRSQERAKLFSWRRFIDQTVQGYRTSLGIGSTS